MVEEKSNAELKLATSSAEAPPPRNSVLLAVVREILQVVVPALLIALLVHLFLAQATVVYGQSMEPNLLQSQRLIIDKLSYRIGAPKRNDIVVLDMPGTGEMLVKRVVGLPGETVEIRAGVLFIDGVEVAQPYNHDLIAFDMAPIALQSLSYFVLGDNRSNSNDSRSFGPIVRDVIIGKVWIRYWPTGQFRLF